MFVFANKFIKNPYIIFKKKPNYPVLKLIEFIMKILNKCQILKFLYIYNSFK